MNDQLDGISTTKQRLTDTALLIVAVTALASWLWRRLRKSSTNESPKQAVLLDDKIGGAVGFPPNP